MKQTTQSSGFGWSPLLRYSVIIERATQRAAASTSRATASPCSLLVGFILRGGIISVMKQEATTQSRPHREQPLRASPSVVAPALVFGNHREGDTESSRFDIESHGFALLLLVGFILRGGNHLGKGSRPHRAAASTSRGRQTESHGFALLLLHSSGVVISPDCAQISVFLWQKKLPRLRGLILLLCYYK